MKYITIKLKTFFIGILLLIAAWVLFAVVFTVPSLNELHQMLERFIYDQVFHSTAEPHKDIIIVDVAHENFNREICAELITGLVKCGAKVIALDVLFQEQGSPEWDHKLAQVTKQAADTVLHAFEFVSEEGAEKMLPEHFALDLADSILPFTSELPVKGAQLPYQELRDATRFAAHISRGYDKTKLELRYFPLFLSFNERVYPSMPLLATMRYLGIGADSLDFSSGEWLELKAPNAILKIPMNAEGSVLVNYIDFTEVGSGKVLQLSAVMNAMKNDDRAFRGKIILVGDSKDSQEQVFGPHFKNYSAIGIHATIISQILNQQNIYEDDLLTLLLNFLLILLGLIWILYFSQNYANLKAWYVYGGAFVLLIVLDALLLYAGIKISVVVPFFTFSLTYVFSKKYFDKQMHGLLGHSERIKYLDFDLLVSGKAKDGVAGPVTIMHSPAGEGSGEFKLRLNDELFKGIRDRLALLRVESQELKDFGAKLFEALFPSGIRDQFDRSMGIMSASNAHLRLKLRIDDPELNSLPWEFVYDGKQSKDFLALHRQVSITRFLALPNPVEKLKFRPPLKVLVAISNPKHRDFPQLDVEMEKNLAKKAFGSLRRRGIVQFTFTKKATVEELSKQLKNGFHIVHYIGHGEYSEAQGGYLLLEDDAGMGNLVSVDRLAKIFESTDVRLVFLNACQTGKATGGDVFMGVAQGLVKSGIPAVIAMQYEIPDESAIEMSSVFYASLSEHFQVDRAVCEARQSLFIKLESGRIDWGIPVLFMREEDGVLFDVS